MLREREALLPVGAGWAGAGLALTGGVQSTPAMPKGSGLNSWGRGGAGVGVGMEVEHRRESGGAKAQVRCARGWGEGEGEGSGSV